MAKIITRANVYIERRIHPEGSGGTNARTRKRAPTLEGDR